MRVDLARGPCVECQGRMMGEGRRRWDSMGRWKGKFSAGDAPRHSDSFTQTTFKFNIALLASTRITPQGYSTGLLPYIRYSEDLHIPRVSSTELIYHPPLLSPPTHGVSLQ